MSRANAIYLCGGPEPAVPDTSDCPRNAEHTPAPTSYLAWMGWADDMSKTHRQRLCAGCGKLAIWIVKVPR